MDSPGGGMKGKRLSNQVGMQCQTAVNDLPVPNGVVSKQKWQIHCGVKAKVVPPRSGPYVVMKCPPTLTQATSHTTTTTNTEEARMSSHLDVTVLTIICILRERTLHMYVKEERAHRGFSAPANVLVAGRHCTHTILVTLALLLGTMSRLSSSSAAAMPQSMNGSLTQMVFDGLGCNDSNLYGEDITTSLAVMEDNVFCVGGVSEALHGKYTTTCDDDEKT
eukprot:scaffold2644_cov78-Skeletonema_marinoi.AAC.6